jgi:hypothetical protein
MLVDVRFADNDYLCKEQYVPQLCAGEEQTETQLLHLVVPGLRIQHSPTEVKHNLFLTVIHLYHHRAMEVSPTDK